MTESELVIPNRATSVERHPHLIRAYAMAIIGVELVSVFVGTTPGAIGHALLAFILMNHYLVYNPASGDTASRVDRWRDAKALPILALVPLLRLLSLVMPIRDMPQLTWYPLIGVPLLVAVGLTVRLLHLSPEMIGVIPRLSFAQVAIALSGVPLGLAGFLLFRPVPLIDHFDWGAVLIAALILLIFTGFAEELIFRGLLQGALQRALGPLGLVWSTVLFSGTYIGSHSLSYLLFITGVGSYFGWCVRRSGSIWGVVLAHAAITIGMLLIFPLTWR